MKISRRSVLHVSGLAAAALALTGTGILLYIVAALVMPENLDVM